MDVLKINDDDDDDDDDDYDDVLYLKFQQQIYIWHVQLRSYNATLCIVGSNVM